MKKHLLSLTSVLIVLSLVLASCNRDDENPVTNETIRLPHKVTWTLDWVTANNVPMRDSGYFYLVHNDQNRIVLPDGWLVYNADGTIASRPGVTFQHEGNFIFADFGGGQPLWKFEINNSGQIIRSWFDYLLFPYSYDEFFYNSNGNLIAQTMGNDWVGDDGCLFFTNTYTYTNIPVFKTDIPQWYLKFFTGGFHDFFLFSGKGYMPKQRIECGGFSGQDCTCAHPPSLTNYTYELDDDGYVIKIKRTTDNTIKQYFIEYRLVGVNR